MKALAYVLTGLILAIQWPLWFGKGGWTRVWDLGRQVEAAKESNQQLAQRNAGLDAEVRDLKQGLGAVEERARNDLGMIKPDELFVQIVEKKAAAKQ
ncbi:MAG: cell division protein FtsB [Burkholderiales bacterium]|nr:cell division protein FtsB [Burkholderiales bacterium]